MNEEERMKTTMLTLIAGTMALLITGVAGAQTGDQDKQCSVKTLKGSYVLTASGYTFVGGVAQPKTIVELIEFNGDGTLTVSGGTISVNGVVNQIPPNGIGDYHIDAECNGSLTFIPGPSFNLFIERDGKSGVAIQTVPQGNVFQGTITRRK
jgi:hypothetical protein